MTTHSLARRHLLKTLSYSALGFANASAFAQTFSFTPNQRYPDPSIFILDPSFVHYRLYNSTLEQLGSGMRWAEGPAYLPQEAKLIFSDIPNNRLMQYDEKTQQLSVYKKNAQYANGNAVDNQGRLITCEHLKRRVIRTEPNGSITVLADQFQGKPLNSPNDVVVRSDGSIWFTDPTFGISGQWEGDAATPEQSTTNVYRIDPDGSITAVITDIINPNGLAFSPNERKLYVLESHEAPNATFWQFDVSSDGRFVSAKKKFIDAGVGAAPDGFCVDQDGNLWCGWGSSGAVNPHTVDIGAGMSAHPPLVRAEDFDGVKIFNPAGHAIGFIRLPERCTNVTFGGAKRNRLYMTASHSLYALYVNAHAPKRTA